ncbi:UNKNOWN [Stylonychia lemnae]|uniref:Adhesin-like protein n=1 Tax=Stylonychia lemnae TaxID=5949 RepID=A0A078AD92_STYLE|nr:UNKNOWN [Stylonychia lemnae]|eukprot:CDW78833.1 UNKNOWN [Stylonychia lemnae]
MNGGSIYCENCQLQFAETLFSNNFALNGGSVTVIGSSFTEFQSIQIINNYAYNYGGFVYIQKDLLSLKRLLNEDDSEQQENQLEIYQSHSFIELRQLSSLIGPILRMISIEDCYQNYAYNKGGVVYADSQDIDIEIDGLIQSETQALRQMGGVIHLQNAKSINITQSDFSIFQSPSGSCISSVGLNTKIHISKTNFLENEEAEFPANYLNSDSPSTYGVIYIKTADLVLFSENVFTNSYQKKYGGAIYISNSYFYDSDSTYEFSLAFNGGIMYLKEMYDVKINNINIEYAMAIENGAAMYIDSSFVLALTLGMEMDMHLFFMFKM